LKKDSGDLSLLSSNTSSSSSPPSSKPDDRPDDDDEIEILPPSRVNSHLTPITGTFTIPPPQISSSSDDETSQSPSSPSLSSDTLDLSSIQAPCTLLLVFQNHYSWFNTKLLSYSVTVRPPSKGSILEKHRLAMTSALEGVEQDLKSAEVRLSRVQDTSKLVITEISRLQSLINEKQGSLNIAAAEEKHLLERVGFRRKQVEGIRDRMGLGSGGEE
jgi:hypothetical protein